LAVDFPPERWDKVRETFRKFWAGELDRPLVLAQCRGRDPGRPMPEVPMPSQGNCHDFSWTPEQIVDRVDWDCSCRVYLGDSFPAFWTGYYGPGCICSFLGAEVHNVSGKVWFKPPRDVPIEDMHFEYEGDNVWLRRVKDVCAAAARRWQGQVLVLMPDLGGPFDVLSMFRPGERLLLDLYDHPAEVARLAWELQDLFHRFYEDLAGAMQAERYGYSDWSRIYCEKPFHMLANDFCYMIGPGMFDEFVKPTLAASCRRLSNSFYHLDGVGQIPHLDSLLAIPELDGIQWVPGTGQPEGDHWPEVFAKIHGAGKKAQVMGGLEVFERVLKRLGGPGPGIVNWEDDAKNFTPDEEPDVRRTLARMGVE